MNTFQIKTSSWHYQVANRVFSSKLYLAQKYDELDICKYRGYVIKAILLLFMMYSVCGVFVYGLIDLALALYFWVAPTEAGITVIVIALGAAIFSLAFYIMYVIEDKKILKDNFISTSYKSWKEKFCLKVEIIKE